MATTRKVCVTGGAGFIGSHLVESLLARGDAVTVLDNLAVGRRDNVPAAARFVEGDVLDERAVREAVEGAAVVFHLAARVAIRSSFEFAVEDATTNLAGTASVLRTAGGVGSVGKVVFTSSMAVYADSETPAPIDEKHPQTPVSPYGVSKLAAEQLTHLMAARSGKASVVLRLFNTYGRRQALSPYVGVVTIFAKTLARGERPVIYGDGEQCRDFVHVEDVAAAFVAAAEAPVSGETFNVGTGEATSVNAVYDAIRRALASDLAARYEPAAPGELRNSVANVTKATHLLGYRPRHRFAESIGEVVRDLVRG